MCKKNFYTENDGLFRESYLLTMTQLPEETELDSTCDPSVIVNFESFAEVNIRFIITITIQITISLSWPAGQSKRYTSSQHDNQTAGLHSNIQKCRRRNILLGPHTDRTRSRLCDYVPQQHHGHSPDRSVRSGTTASGR